MIDVLFDWPGKAAYTFIVNKPPEPGLNCEMVNVTVDAGVWQHGIPEGIMTQSSMSYTCERTCVDNTNDDFILTVRYAMVSKIYEKPSDDALTPIGTSGE